MRALRAALRNGFEVVTAKSVEEAQEAMSGQIKVALVDIRLSESDPSNQEGVTFLQWAKAHFPETPVLMMSAYRDFDALVQALNLGADYFLKKPIDLKELRSLLRKFSEQGRIPELTAELKKSLDKES